MKIIRCHTTGTTEQASALPFHEEQDESIALFFNDDKDRRAPVRISKPRPDPSTHSNLTPPSGSEPSLLPTLNKPFDATAMEVQYWTLADMLVIGQNILTLDEKEDWESPSEKASAMARFFEMWAGGYPRIKSIVENRPGTF